MREGRQKFSAGVRYYHRHAQAGDHSKASLDWREHRVFVARQRRRRFVVFGLIVLITSGLVAATFALLLR